MKCIRQNNHTKQSKVFFLLILLVKNTPAGGSQHVNPRADSNDLALPTQSNTGLVIAVFHVTSREINTLTCKPRPDQQLIRQIKKDNRAFWGRPPSASSLI